MRPQRPAAPAAGLCPSTTVAVIVITAVVNEPANRLFATAGALDDAQTTALLDKWMRWHWLRVTLGLVAFAAALRTIR